MVMNLKRDFMFVCALTAVVIGYGFCGDAEAQTTQPVYIRPSKGAAITLPVFNATGFGFQNSTVFDWSAFDSMQVYATMNAACIAAAVSWEIDVVGATTATGTFQVIKGSFNQTAYRVSTASNPAFYAVSGLPPFVKLRVAAPGAVAGCALTVTIVPYPISLIQKVQGPKSADTQNVVLESDPPVLVGGIAGPPGSNEAVPRFFRTDGSGYLYVLTSPDPGSQSLPATTPIAVAASPAPATVIFSSSASGPKTVVLQNVGVWPVACAAGTNAASVSLTRYNFMLAAGSTVGDGTGGNFAVENMKALDSVYCIGNGGASSIAITPR